MADENSDKITAFDTLFTTNHIRMCKVLLPHLEPRFRAALAVYIKFSELLYTMSYFNLHPDSCFGICRQSSPTDDKIKSSSSGYADLLREILPYSSAAGQKQINEMIKLLEQFKNIQDMLEMAELIKEMFPESGEGMPDIMSVMNSSGSDGLSFDPEILSQLFSIMKPEQNI